MADHAKSEQHERAMSLMKTAQAKANKEPIEQYSQIAQLFSTVSSDQMPKIKHKFEICFTLAKEGVAFAKYPTFHSLAERQGVNLGSSYRGSDYAQQFTYYIAEAQRGAFVDLLSSKVRFVSFLMDGSTDSGNKEQELVFVVYCKVDDVTMEVRSETRYLAILNPSCATAVGLLDCLKSALDRINVNFSEEESHLDSESSPVLVGGGTDGASMNVGIHNGMKAKMQQLVPWLFWSWCFSHRLELACKDACISSVFKDINEMLLRLFYLYNNSPKKSTQLAEIVKDLEAAFHFPKGGNIPIR